MGSHFFLFLHLCNWNKVKYQKSRHVIFRRNLKLIYNVHHMSWNAFIVLKTRKVVQGPCNTRKFLQISFSFTDIATTSLYQIQIARKISQMYSMALLQFFLQLFQLFWLWLWFWLKFSATKGIFLIRKSFIAFWNAFYICLLLICVRPSDSFFNWNLQQKVKKQ